MKRYEKLFREMKKKALEIVEEGSVFPEECKWLRDEVLSGSERGKEFIELLAMVAVYDQVHFDGKLRGLEFCSDGKTVCTKELLI